MSERPIITEDDWIKPLILLRNIADDRGVLLTEAQEQDICHAVTEAITSALLDEVLERELKGVGVA